MKTDTPALDIAANRRQRKYSKKDLARRVLWVAGEIVFRTSLRPFFGFRRFILRLFGSKIGNHVHIYPSARIYFPWNLEIGDWSAIGEDAFIYNLGKVKIGERVTISQRAHLCAGTHDYRSAQMPLLKPEIHVKDQVWICADAFVGPGVTIGEGTVVGARAVAMRDVESWIVVSGNPAAFLKKRVMQPDDQTKSN